LRAADVIGSCSAVFKYGFKPDFNPFLATLGASAPVQTLTQLRQFNTANAGQNAIRYRQDLLDVSDEMNVTADRSRYQLDRAKDIDLAAVGFTGRACSEPALIEMAYAFRAGDEKAGAPALHAVVLFDDDGGSAERDAGDLAGGDFDLRGRDDFVLPFDTRDAAAHQLGGAQARDDDEFKRVCTAGTLNQCNLLPESVFGARVRGPYYTCVIR
jgi:hypothetical protein